jgi:prevent-host-death family protein
MTTINVHEEKTHLSRLLNRVATGEKLTNAKAGRADARLVPVEFGAEPRKRGMDAGSICID